MADDRVPDSQSKPNDDEQDEAFLEKAKDKLSEMVEAPEAADYDTTKTNPVTGQRRQ